VTIVGGLAALLGSLMAWVQFGGFGTGRGAKGPSFRGRAITGTSLVSGKVALVAGTVLILVGLSLWIMRGDEFPRVLAVVALVAGAVVLGAAIAAFQTDGLGLLGNAFGRSPGRGQGGGLGRFRILGQLSPSHGPGLYLALAGGIVAVAGAVAAVFWTTTPVRAAPRDVAVPSTTTESFSKGRAA
jgi:hypothetical protein